MRQYVTLEDVRAMLREGGHVPIGDLDTAEQERAMRRASERVARHLRRSHPIDVPPALPVKPQLRRVRGPW